MPYKEMKDAENDLATYSYRPVGKVNESVTGLCAVIKKDPEIIRPSRGDDKVMKEHLASRYGIPEDEEIFRERKPLALIDRYYIFPTVKKTTLFYDREAGCFIKILNPVNVKHRALSLFVNRARLVYDLSAGLNAKGITVPEVTAYGMFKEGRKAFWVMERVAGKSLYTILNIEKQVPPFGIFMKVIDRLADLHMLGYWFGDLRIAHVFIDGSKLSGFVDVDSIKKNMPYKLRNLAKDLAGLNSPDLPLSADDKKRLFAHYLKRMGMKKDEKFRELIRQFTVKRWGRKA